ERYDATFALEERTPPRRQSSRQESRRDVHFPGEFPATGEPGLNETPRAAGFPDAPTGFGAPTEFPAPGTGFRERIDRGGGGGGIGGGERGGTDRGGNAPPNFGNGFGGFNGPRTPRPPPSGALVSLSRVDGGGYRVHIPLA